MVYCDSQSAVHLTKHHTFHNRSKHIDVKHYFVRDVVERGDVQIVKIPTEENQADALTKPLPVAKFRLCLNLVKCR